MSDKRNIDRLFQEKFKDFEASPSKDLWNTIEAQLETKKKDRKVIPFWWKFGGIAAGLAILFSIGYNLIDNDTSTNSIEVTNSIKENSNPSFSNPENKDEAVVEANPNKNQINTSSNPKKDKSATITSASTVSSKQRNTDTATKINSKAYSESSKQKNYESLANNKKGGLSIAQNESNNPLDKNNKIGVQQDNSLTNRSTLLNSLKEEEEVVAAKNSRDGKISIFDAIEKEKELAVNKKPNKWSLNPTVAPVYYSTLSGGSPIHSQFDGNNKSGNINMSYGLNLAYQINDKLSVRSGVNKVAMGYNTNNVEFSPSSFNAEVITNVAFSNESSRLMVSNDLNKGTLATIAETPAESNIIYDGAMNQQLGYIEVPLELKYRILDDKFGINLIGGMSSLFLTHNNITLETIDGLKTRMGEATNLNSTNFSTNFGIGFDYNFSDRFLINMEPMFKYQLNTFSSGNNGFKPYTLGVYTGFSFRF
ncbi:outer membrane beta-barrel protein [Zhouia amylolytica]|uniref:Uncharacterized protein n=1 Tax=Zhouia amylolytica AD3 TaxID=1286632 RepID=W2ULB8_9FLAO|nr:outer membrane beta-barrel protein [Zhouia amylolytica]ETN94132.1 hypothetical protein P278_29360 [Zhouia amylolytica AD3]